MIPTSQAEINRLHELAEARLRALQAYKAEIERLNSPFNASRELEIVVGTDRVVRINVDGICAFRARFENECELVIRNDLSPRPYFDPSWLLSKDKGQE